MMVSHKDFDWSLTDREIVIFIPNWNRGNFIRKTVASMSTKVPRDKWVIVVGNDCAYQDLSDLENENVFTFTFNADVKRQHNRGGGYIRNVAIKRCRSKWFFQRDPEVIIENDWIENILNCKKDLYKLSGPAYRVRQDVTERFMTGNATINDCKRESDLNIVHMNHFVFFNMAFAVQTKILQEMHGYDEDHWGTYCYDQDLYLRLIANGITPHMDVHCKPIHLWHETPSLPNTDKTNQEYEEMKQLLAKKNPKNFVRNPNGWGEGGIEVGCFDG